MKYPLAELIDRMSIEKLKEERISNYKSNFGNDALRYCFSIIPDKQKSQLLGYFDDLYNWNGKIWDLESDIRQGKEGELGLEEVGRRAITIREFNKKRIEVKNEITKVFGGYQEIKHDHASQ